MSTFFYVASFASRKGQWWATDLILVLSFLQLLYELSASISSDNCGADLLILNTSTATLPIIAGALWASGAVSEEGNLFLIEVRLDQQM
jgi:hypothetical protein